MDKWQIKYYSHSNSGKFPVKEFIDNLPIKIKGRVYYSLELLSEFGLNLKMPHCKKVAGTPLWELRILGKKSLRIFYIATIEKTFLLLHGFLKKTQKTPKKEIKIALTRLENN